MILDILVFGVAFAALVSGRVPMQAVFLGLIMGAVLLGRLGFNEALALLADPSLFAVVCFVIASRVLTQLYWLKRFVFGAVHRGLRPTLLRFLAAVGSVSAVMPNTAVVGTFMGPATRYPGATAHKLLLPLSFMALAGGMMTPFGTSANLIVVGQAEKLGIHLGLVDFLLPGLAVFAAVLAALVAFAPLILRDEPRGNNEKNEFFHIEGKVLAGSSLIGKSIAENNLRNLDHFYVAEIIRDGRVISPVHPAEPILEHDILILVGDIRYMAELQVIDGLETELSTRHTRRDAIFHAVVGADSILVGATLKEIGFRARFDASVLAIRRGQERLSGKLGETEIRGGDLLVISAGPDFLHRDDIQPDLHILEVEDPGQRPVSSGESMLILGFFLGLIGLALVEIIPLALATFILVIGSLLFGWLHEREIRRNFPFDLTIMLWGSLTLGVMIDRSGIDELVARSILDLTAGQAGLVTLITLFLVTWLMTELLSNASAAVAAIPIAMELARSLGAPPTPFVMTVAFGASASFLMPFGYQTHLMVLTPGRYRLKHFVLLGTVVLIAYAVAGLSVISALYL